MLDHILVKLALVVLAFGPAAHAAESAPPRDAGERPTPPPAGEATLEAESTCPRQWLYCLPEPGSPRTSSKSKRVPDLVYPCRRTGDGCAPASPGEQFWDQRRRCVEAFGDQYVYTYGNNWGVCLYEVFPSTTLIDNQFWRLSTEFEQPANGKVAPTILFVNVFADKEHFVKYAQAQDVLAYFDDGERAFIGRAKGGGALMVGALVALGDFLAELILDLEYTIQALSTLGVRSGEALTLHTHRDDYPVDDKVFVVISETPTLDRLLREGTAVHWQGWLELGKNYAVINKTRDEKPIYETWQNAHETCDVIEIPPPR